MRGPGSCFERKERTLHEAYKKQPPERTSSSRGSESFGTRKGKSTIRGGRRVSPQQAHYLQEKPGSRKKEKWRQKGRAREKKGGAGLLPCEKPSF